MNRELLEYTVARAGYSASAMAKRLGISRTSYYNKLSGYTPFNLNDMCVLISACGLNMDEVRDIFFSKVVN